MVRGWLPIDYDGYLACLLACPRCGGGAVGEKLIADDMED